MSQGHKWDVSNNLHLLNDPSLFTLNSMVTSVQVPSNNVYADSSMSMSGLDQEMLDASKEGVLGLWDAKEDSKEQDNDLEKELQADALKHDMASQKAKASSLTSLGLLNFNALSTYVTCDSPPPIQMTAEEMHQLDKCKVHGLPKKQEGAFVPRELRHGWWRITDPDQLKELIDALHPRGARERELQASLVQNTPTINNKLYIDKGDASCTELSITPLDRAIMASGGYPPPEPPGSFCAVTARRCDMQLLAMVEALEERVAAASMQVPGWRPSRLALPEEATGAEIVARARHKLASLEAHIERRYLKPPLVQSNSDASLGAARQAEHGNASAPSPHDSDVESKPESKSLARGLTTWREAVARCNTSAQLAMLAAALEAATAWDKSVMKANCQFCLLGDNEGQLLLCDGCDKGYHTYCFKPSMEKIPEGDWYCWVCVNKARGERVCIVCGGACAGRTIPCALCVRAYHPDCHYPPLPKNPRGKWYCSQCISRAPPKKPRNMKKKDSKHKDVNTSVDADQNMVPSPAPSHASTSTLAEDASCDVAPPEPSPDQPPLPPPVPPDLPEDGPPPEKRRNLQYVGGNGALQHETDGVDGTDGIEPDAENVPLLSRAKKEKHNAKKLQKELQFCKNLLYEMECHEHAWPFLLPVNTKLFPQYKKVIKCPMDLSTIKKKLQDNTYKCKEEFASDVRLIFSNCEVFNEDYSPVGRAGHNMREFFDSRWTQI
ncbi:bromodomain adjacent to zinc finger domain protein 2A-like [Leguminivora glycinivorella]|uniref:bromodomain adjacent to zinc finger domain protein 2A-like n=1 Tax=Leguminivora glycinivorella TaxID=1035111 RepID=UPI00200DE44F|nr:bromodomain adjacent to zinc finger domain protein 2A-like [Leguminivora glycinivorella]